MTRRKLTDEEVDLWRRVVERTERMHPETEAPPRPLPKPKPQRKPAPIRIDAFDVGQSARNSASAHDFKPGLAERLHEASVRMDRKSFQRMKRGKLKPEARLDLHGKRLDQAHGELIRFILTAQASGRRLVLVITGKGKDRDEPGPIPTPRGVLRNQVPQWLNLPPLAQAVLQITPAHQRHGGEGAYYVYLRRDR